MRRLDTLTGANRGSAWPAPVQQWAIIGLLLVLCASKGLWFVHGITVPPDTDIVRDLGFIQAAIDGNFSGDPTNADALRWYPPLVHGLAGGFAWLSGIRLLPFWIQAGPWINLLSPLMFFLMNRRLIGPWPAVAATVVLVLFNGATMPSDAAAGYTPFSLTPSLVWPMFFGSVWLIHARTETARFGNALLIGAALGLVFLAHTVPAILLSAIVTGVAISRGGLRPPVLLWLACVAITELTLSALFLAPLIMAYRLHIVNPIPGAWMHELLTVPPLRKWLIAVNLPGALALAGCIALRRYGVADRSSVVIFATWISVCGLFLMRHVACGYLDQTGGVCGIFVIAVHHYHVYLQAAWASLIGLALCLALRRWNLTPRWPVWVTLAGAAVVGYIGFVTGSWDLDKRRAALADPDALLNLEAYHWILAHTAPQALFATPLPGMDASPSNIGPEAAAVIAAGRRLVAAPARHANPYIEWPERNARRIRYLAALDGGPDAAQALCGFAREAAPGSDAFFLVANELAVNASAVTPVLRGKAVTIYRVVAESCGDPPSRPKQLPPDASPGAAASTAIARPAPPPG